MSADLHISQYRRPRRAHLWLAALFIWALRTGAMVGFVVLVVSGIYVGLSKLEHPSLIPGTPAPVNCPIPRDNQVTTMRIGMFAGRLMIEGCSTQPRGRAR